MEDCTETLALVPSDEDFEEGDDEEQEDDDMIDEDEDDDLEAPEAVPLLEPSADKLRKAQKKVSYSGLC